MCCDPAGVPAHDFDNHDALVRFSCSVETVNRFCYYLHGGVETERVVGACQIVIDRLGNADNGIPFLLEKLVRNTESILAADGHKRVQAKFLPVRLEFLNVIHLLEWICAGRSENCAASGQD